jgi:hypothetical protein
MRTLPVEPVNSFSSLPSRPTLRERLRRTRLRGSFKTIQFTKPELIAVSTLPYFPERVNFRKSLVRIGLQPALNII